ncbi:hypothetical protein CGLO_10847 [Colletotrichum gloeosporioides Cg-14]|nr:hypothetical protein CGLO_10847 [Colletotrichum gloeosporioides Cg-14]
MIEKINS